ncbi:MAG: peptidoglycan-binding protein [Candidatus Saccharimonadales bacterium]
MDPSNYEPEDKDTPKRLSSGRKGPIIRSGWSKLLLMLGIVVAAIMAVLVAVMVVTHGQPWQIPHPTAASKTLSVTPPVVCTADSPVIKRPDLRQGHHGPCVVVLQNLLGAHGYKFYQERDIFGPNTENAVRQFQQANGIGIDGVVGQETWETLINPKEMPATSPTVDDSSAPAVETSKSTEPESPTPSAPTTNPPSVTPTPSQSSVPSVTPTPKPQSTKPPKAAPYHWTTGPNLTKHVVLTFDDCPKSLAAFKQTVRDEQSRGIALVLAPTGDCIKRQAFDVTYALDHGHFVINHSVNHLALTTLSVADIIAELNSPGVQSSYVRPPFGDGTFGKAGIDAKLLKALKLKAAADGNSGMQIWTWDVDTNDWMKGRTITQIVNEAVNSSHPGSTVLMHMNHGAFNDDTIERIQKGLAVRGLTICPNYGKPAPLRPTSADICHTP